MFLNFCETVGNDLSVYDEDEAWPSLFDDFVEYENDKVNQNVAPDKEKEEKESSNWSKIQHFFSRVPTPAAGHYIINLCAHFGLFRLFDECFFKTFLIKIDSVLNNIKMKKLRKNIEIIKKKHHHETDTTGFLTSKNETRWRFCQVELGNNFVIYIPTPPRKI